MIIDKNLRGLKLPCQKISLACKYSSKASSSESEGGSELDQLSGWTGLMIPFSSCGRVILNNLGSCCSRVSSTILLGTWVLGYLWWRKNPLWWVYWQHYISRWLLWSHTSVEGVPRAACWQLCALYEKAEWYRFPELAVRCNTSEGTLQVVSNWTGPRENPTKFHVDCSRTGTAMANASCD